MKALSSAVQAVLATRSYFSCRLVTLQLVSGITLNWSGADCDIYDPTTGTTFTCGGQTGPFLEMADTRMQLHQKLGTDVDQITMEVTGGSATIGGLSYFQAALRRQFAGAFVQIREAVAANTQGNQSWPFAVTGSYVVFSGFVAEVDGGSAKISLTVNTAMDRLQSQWPRNLVAPTCVNILGSSLCGVTLSPLAVTSTAQSGSTAGIIICGLAQAADYFDLGVLSFTSGTNAGLSRSVRLWTPGSATLMTPFPQAPATGDNFTITPGCDLSTGPNGCAKFSNFANFRGFPFVPAPSTAGA